MKQQENTMRRNNKLIAGAAAAAVVAVALTFLSTCEMKQSSKAAAEAASAPVVTIEENSVPQAGVSQPAAVVEAPVQAAEPVAEDVAEPVVNAAAAPVIAVPVVNVRPAAPAVTEPEVTEPEVTEPEVTEPEVTEPEVTEPEVTEPEVTEPEVTEPEVTEPEVTEPVVEEQSVSTKAVSWLWKQLDVEGSTIKEYFAKRAAMTSLDSDGPNFAPEVNAALEAAEIGLTANSGYGWRIWKGTENAGYNIFFTEDQLAEQAKGTVLENVVKANTKELEAAEAAGDLEAAIEEGSAVVAVKQVADTNNVKVEVSYIDGGSFVADPEPETGAEG